MGDEDHLFLGSGDYLAILIGEENTMRRYFLLSIYIIGLVVALRAILAVTPHWFGYVVLAASGVWLAWSIVRARAERRATAYSHDN